MKHPPWPTSHALLLLVGVVAAGAGCEKKPDATENEPMVTPGKTGGRSGSGGRAGAGSGGSGGNGGSGGVVVAPNMDANGGSSGDASTAPEAGVDLGGSSDGGPVGSLIDNPLGKLPTNLKDVGLFLEFPSTTKAHGKAFKFSPRYPLYSNGLDKGRYFVMPEGKQINSMVRDTWDFPVGTLLFKTFSFKDPANGGKDKPVETRLIRRIADTGKVTEQWQFAVWEWNAAGDAATLVDMDRFLDPIPREVTVDGEKISHRIPDLTMCWNCHVANRSPVIGFDELRLNSKLEVADTDTQLAKVIANKWLTTVPAAPLAEVKGRTPLELSVLEYFQANCAHCHNGEQTPLKPGARYPQLDLRYDKAVAQTVGISTMTVGTASGTRIVPKNPAKSVLIQAMRAVANPLAVPDVKPMPLVGVDRMDKKAVEMIEQWINTLSP